MAKIVILGGGFGGIVAANRLRKMLEREHKIVLVDKCDVHIYNPSLLLLVFGEREPERIKKDLSVLNKKGIEYVNAEVLKIDPAKKNVATSGGDFDYDYLVISLGAELARERIPGFKDFKESYNFYCLNGAAALRDGLKDFHSGKVAIAISSTPFKCPAAPYELALLLDAHFSDKLLRKATEIAVYTPEPYPMPSTGPEVGNAVREMIEKRGISFNPGKKLKSFGNKELVFEDGSNVQADLIPWVPPHKAPSVAADSGLTDETGWIPIDGKTMKTRFDGVYAIGDITANKLPSGIMLPKAGVFAHFEAEVAAHNIASEINKSGALKKFDGKGYCFLEMGHGVAGFASGNFYAVPKPVVNLKKPGRIWHWGKVAVEKWWMWKWF